MEYDVHHRDLSVPLKLTLGHRHQPFRQAFPFSEVGIMMCHAGDRGISWSFQSLIRG